MSHEMTALALKQTGLSPAQKIVLFWIADHHNGETGECFPSLKRIAALAEISVRSAISQIASLEEKGILMRVERHADDGRQTSNGYAFHFNGDVQNVHRPSANIADTPMQDLHTNLVRNNLGNEPLEKTNQKTEQKSFFTELEIKPVQQSDFDAFWEICPRKIGKGAARKAYVAALKKTNHQTIMEQMAAYAASRTGQHDKYTVHPSTWLNQERWEDCADPIRTARSSALDRAMEALDAEYYEAGASLQIGGPQP